VKERPILFSGPMVRALLDGSKTQTRRVVRKQFGSDAIPAEVPATSPEGWQVSGHSGRWWDDVSGCDADSVICPFGVPGDHLWVRETHEVNRVGYEESWSGGRVHHAGVKYQADDGRAEFPIDEALYRKLDATESRGWTPSIHMPRWASRITLEVAGVRVERLQDISAADARAEGVEFQEHRIAGDVCRSWKAYGSANGWYPEGKDSAPRLSFRSLWDSLATAESEWIANPWVWVVEFKRVT
jgi:hypothetical protein